MEDDSTSYNSPNQHHQSELTESLASERVVHRIGNYVMIENDELGEGSFGRVFKGYERYNKNNVVAIKVINKSNVAGISIVGNPIGENEVLMLKRLKKVNSPNIVRLIGHEDTYYSFYIITEYCNGGNLATYLYGNGNLRYPAYALDHLLFQLAEGMRVIYDLQIIHRDLKPENILLHVEKNQINPPFNELIIKIGDFGMATILPTDVYYAYTQLGTPLYMAPEVLLGLHYDAKVDLWSIGMMTYECLTGELPIQANSIRELKSFYNNNYGFHLLYPNGTTYELQMILESLLKFNPQDRMELSEFLTTDFNDLYHFHN